MRVETIGQVVPSPDGAWVAYTRTRAVMDDTKSAMVTRIHLARSDGTRRFRLTSGETSSTSPAFAPDSKSVYFLSRRSGNPDIWRIAIDGGEARRVTEWNGLIAGFRVSPDGKWIAFRGREKDDAFEKAKEAKLDFRVMDEDPKNDALWLVPIGVFAKKQAPKRLSDGTVHVKNFVWAPDASRILFEHWPRPDPDDWLRSDISELEIASGKIRTIAADQVSERTPKYSPDGKRIAYVRSLQPGNWAGEGRLVVMNLADGATEAMPLTRDEFGRGSRLLGFTGDSKRLIFTETRGTRNVLVAMDSQGEQRALGDFGSATLAGYGRGSGLDMGGTNVGFVKEGFDQPAEAFILDLADDTTRQVSNAHAGFPKPPLGRTEVIRWQSKDGLEIEGLLTYPVGHEKGTRVPLVLVIHGGPMGVFTQTFTGARGLYPIATFAAKGYAVLRPNPRGSSGYGKAFRMANLGDWGGGDYQDILAGVDKAIEMGVADPKRMAVMGWSYGGFMTSWIIGRTDRFRAACVGAAVTNLWSFAGTSDILDFLPFYFDGDPWEAFDAYRKHSPMSWVSNVKTPALVLHGEADRRVPISQGYEFYNALKRRGVETRMVVYPRTPHGPKEPKFLLDVAKRHVAWVEQHAK